MRSGAFIPTNTWYTTYVQHTPRMTFEVRARARVGARVGFETTGSYIVHKVLVQIMCM